MPMTSSIRNPGRDTAVRIAAMLACVTTIAGCGSEHSTSWPQLFAVSKLAFNGHDAGSLQQQASNIPYASMGIRLGDGDEQIVVLASDVVESRLWTSASKMVFVTKHGRIINTVHLAYNLDATRFVGTDPLLTFGKFAASPREATHYINLYDINSFSIPVHCTVYSRGPDDVVILGKNISTHRVDEICTCPSLDWSFTNSYWMDDKGFVWESIQHTHPNLKAIKIEVLRPPADSE